MTERHYRRRTSFSFVGLLIPSEYRRYNICALRITLTHKKKERGREREIREQQQHNRTRYAETSIQNVALKGKRKRE